MHDRVSIHQMCFASLSIADYVARCRDLGARRIGFNVPALLADDGLKAAQAALAGSDIAVESLVHVLMAGQQLSPDKASWQEPRENLVRAIDAAAALGARSIYMLTGGHGGLVWEEAADCFSAIIAPCIDRAKAAGVKLAIENASSLYADLHIAHTLADTIRLAEMADVGICIETFFCWAEAGLDDLIRRALPRCVLIQLSDYVLGDRSLPARAVPGDGAIPIEHIVRSALDAGYKGVFDLELLGPRIAAEGAEAATARAARHVSAILDRLCA